MLCSHCGASLRHTARVCIQCGTAVPNPGSPPDQSPYASPVLTPAPQPPPPASIEAVAAIPPATPVYEAAPAAAITPPPEAAPSANANAPVPAPGPSAAPTGPAPKASSSWGWWLVGAALGVGGYLLAQALGTPSLSSNTTSAPSQRVAQLQAPPPVSSSGNASAVVLNTDDLNAMLRMAAADDWGGVQALLRGKRPQTHLVKDKATARVFNQAGLDLINQGDWIAAHGMFEMGVQANANDAEIRNNLGFVELRLGRHNSAQQNLITTLLMAPTRTNAWSNLAELMAETNQATTAAASLRLAVHFSRNQKRTLDFLSDPARMPSAALREVINSHWAAIEATPPYTR